MAAEDATPPGGGDDEGIPLRTMGDIDREMGRVYRDMRKKRLPIADGNGLTQTLQYMAKVKREAVSDDLLQRIAELERRQAESEEQRAAH